MSNLCFEVGGVEHLRLKYDVKVMAKLEMN